MKARVFHVVSDVKHPETGAELLNENTIKDALNHRSIKQWAYVLHDKDVYLDTDEKKNPNHKEGEKKHPHWHIVFRSENAISTTSISKWFGIPENFIECPKGKGSFLDNVEYLTHENPKQIALGKCRYPDEEIKANFNWRDEVDKRRVSKLKYGDLDEKDRMFYEVTYDGKTLKQCRQENEIFYMNNLKKLQQLRLEYISNIAENPSIRINYYVEGEGGYGKGLISRALARGNIDPIGKLDDDEIFFEIGSDSASFEGYDGQPVIIWNDCRAATLLTKLGGRENVFNIFDPFPPNIRQNVKYSSIRLINKINIVNSVEHWDKFLDGLAGEYENRFGKHKAEDKKQSYRRFPMFLVIHENDFDLGVNKGMLNGTREFEQYEIMKGFQGSLRKIVDVCGNNKQLTNEINFRTIKPVLDTTNQIEDKMSHDQKYSDDEVREIFKDYGKSQEQIEREQSFNNESGLPFC